jgi:uncharacterized protein YndB with AHSA1/START domain
MAEYKFITRWHIAAPIEQVWDAIVHSEDWSQWWKAVESVVELEPGEADGLGNVRRFVWKTPLGYALTFETRVICIQAPTLLEATAIGDAEGHGLWELATLDCGTEVHYTWTVRTTQRWMNVLAAIARPLLEWNHNVIMQQGGQGLAAYLNAGLISAESADRSRSTAVVSDR